MLSRICCKNTDINHLYFTSSTVFLFQFECFLAPLTDDGADFGHWLDRNGNPENYFNGNTPGVHTCSCGTFGNCTDQTQTCNCDAKDPVVEKDDGNINY